MSKLNFYEWLLKEGDLSPYKKKLEALNNALGLNFDLSDEDGMKSAGNVQISTLKKEVVKNFTKNTLYSDIKDSVKKTAIDEILSKPNAKVSDLANLLAGLSKE